MPAYLDEKTKMWYCKFYYQDAAGIRHQKLKRGFKLQREAKAWEREFLANQRLNPDMTFQALYDIYIEDMSHRLKPSTYNVRKHQFAARMLPFFKDKPISEIKPADVRRWQNTLISDNASPTYQRTLHSQLSAIFNYAVKYCGLKSNPCRIAGRIGKQKGESMDFWIPTEFEAAMRQITDPEIHLILDMLYFGGFRSGELLALTPDDLDFDSGQINVDKSVQRIGGQDIVTSPKTDNSIRVVPMPLFVMQEAQGYVNRLYGIRRKDPIFHVSRDVLRDRIGKAAAAAGVKRIRLHDTRHSHVSLLIDLGFTPMLIAERIGDTVDMVNNTYGHLFPNRHAEVATKLQQFKKIVSN
nr:MAG TPA: Integrase [Caudoviricetes sp.]